MSDVGNEVKQALANKLGNVQAQAFGVPVKKKKGDSPWFTAGCIAILVISVLSMVSVAVYKKYKAAPTEPNAAVVQGEKSITIQDLRTGIKPVLDAQDNRIAALERRVDTIAHRQWLLSLAHNENAALTEAVTGRIAPDLKDKHIFIDSEWKLNKVPEFVRLTEEDKRSLMGK